MRSTSWLTDFRNLAHSRRREAANLAPGFDAMFRHLIYPSDLRYPITDGSDNPGHIPRRPYRGPQSAIVP